MKTVSVTYNGAFPVLLTGAGHRIVRGEPIELPWDMAKSLVGQRPDEFTATDAELAAELATAKEPAEGGQR